MQRENAGQWRCEGCIQRNGTLGRVRRDRQTDRQAEGETHRRIDRETQKDRDRQPERGRQMR